LKASRDDKFPDIQTPVASEARTRHIQREEFESISEGKIAAT